MVWLIPVLLAISVLGGMKTVCVVRLWKDEENTFSSVWMEKQLYVWSLIWMAGYSMTWLASGKSAEAVRLADLIGTFGILAAVDGKRRIVPDFILCCLFAGQMLTGALTMAPGQLLEIFFTGLIFSLLLTFLVWMSKGRAGMGDARLLGVTAMTAGWAYALQILILGLFFSFIYSVGLVVFCRKSMKTMFPFVPFLAAGAAVHMLLQI